MIKRLMVTGLVLGGLFLVSCGKGESIEIKATMINNSVKVLEVKDYRSYNGVVKMYLTDGTTLITSWNNVVIEETP